MKLNSSISCCICFLIKPTLKSWQLWILQAYFSLWFLLESLSWIPFTATFLHCSLVHRDFVSNKWFLVNLWDLLDQYIFVTWYHKGDKYCKWVHIYVLFIVFHWFPIWLISVVLIFAVATVFIVLLIVFLFLFF